jgi:hypothetical protein
MIDRGSQVDMVRSDPGRDGELQLGRLGDPLGSQIGRPEGL